MDHHRHSRPGPRLSGLAGLDDGVMPESTKHQPSILGTANRRPQDSRINQTTKSASLPVEITDPARAHSCPRPAAAAASNPAKQQWFEIKAQHRGILFFRMGDFYELFHDDAEITHRFWNHADPRSEGVPMAGIPYHAEGYLATMLEEGCCAVVTN